MHSLYELPIFLFFPDIVNQDGKEVTRCILQFLTQNQCLTEHFSTPWSIKIITSRRYRGLSGINTSPARAATAGRKHTDTNTLQLRNWNAVPILKLQPATQIERSQHFISITRLLLTLI